MDSAKVVALRRHPLILARSAWLSARHQSANAGTLSILAHPLATIDRRESAQLELGGELMLGYWPNGKELPGSRRAVLQLAERSRLTTTGWVLMAGGVRVQLRPEAELTIGAGTYLNADVTVDCSGRMTIGSDCAVARGVTIMDSDLHALVVDGRDRPMQVDVTIEDHVWIGAGATILKGVRLGEGCVVGAGAVVTRDVKPGEVVVGSPARPVGERAEWW